MGLRSTPPTITATMLPIPLLQQLEDQDLAFVLTRVPNVIPPYRWACRIGPEGNNAIRSFGHSASEALSEAATRYKSATDPSDLNPA